MCYELLKDKRFKESPRCSMVTVVSIVNVSLFLRSIKLITCLQGASDLSNSMKQNIRVLSNM